MITTYHTERHRKDKNFKEKKIGSEPNLLRRSITKYSKREEPIDIFESVKDYLSFYQDTLESFELESQVSQGFTSEDKIKRIKEDQFD